MELCPFFHESSNYVGRGSNSQKPSTELGRWKHWAPRKRKHKSNSLACHKPQQQLLLPQEIHIPSTSEQEAARKHEQREYETGRKSWHTLLQAPTTASSSGFCNFYSINLCVCPVALKCQEDLDRAWQKPPHLNHSQTAQTSPTV